MGERERLRLLLCLLPDRDRDLSPLERSRLDLSLKGGTIGMFTTLTREIYFSCANYVSIKEKRSARGLTLRETWLWIWTATWTLTSQPWT